MDLSALIFVALAVAWAVYLVPKALRHHDDVARSRSVERFSHTMRVLARREPVNRKSARLVVTPGRPASESRVVTKPRHQPVETPVPARQAAEQTVQQVAEQAPPTPAQVRARRAAAKRATKRRRNVLALVLLVNLVVVGLAAFSVVSWWYTAIPATLLVAWLATCRIMVKGERRGLEPTRRLPVDPIEEEPVEAPEDQAAEAAEGDDPMADTSAGLAAVVDPALWDPVPVTLPTYVGKPAATRRTVRTIDLEGTGVWTSGRSESDSQIAREADEAEKVARQARTEGKRATGS
ncbi:hypothetical protein [Nocardioides sp.]|uniref:divisome protein SepX/GlpR n=1 Tax=Nocardioides sp. TaxID=35761 RepID=UPI0037841344